MEVSEVKTVKPSKQNESQSIINGVSDMRNPMGISTATLPDSRNYLQVLQVHPMGIQNSATTVRFDQNIFTGNHLNQTMHIPRHLFAFTQNQQSQPRIQGPSKFNNPIQISYSNATMINKPIGQYSPKEVDLAKH